MFFFFVFFSSISFALWECWGAALLDLCFLFTNLLTCLWATIFTKRLTNFSVLVFFPCFAVLPSVWHSGFVPRGPCFYSWWWVEVYCGWDTDCYGAFNSFLILCTCVWAGGRSCSGSLRQGGSSHLKWTAFRGFTGLTFDRRLFRTTQKCMRKGVLVRAAGGSWSSRIWLSNCSARCDSGCSTWAVPWKPPVKKETSRWWTFDCLYFQEYIASSIFLDITWFDIIGVVATYWDRTDSIKIVKSLYYIRSFKSALAIQ